jgi:predicted transposase YbfD/YdcC
MKFQFAIKWNYSTKNPSIRKHTLDKKLEGWKQQVKRSSRKEFPKREKEIFRKTAKQKCFCSFYN